jgi:hypothetical protein
MKKVCTKCYDEKDDLLFAKSKSSKDGYKGHCKECDNKMRNSRRSNEEGKLKQKEDYKKRMHDDGKLKFNERRRELYKNRIETDINYKLHNKIRSAILQALKKKGYSKNSRTYEILGCSYENFSLYLEKNFESWMTWNNHGNYTGNYNETWQIDHIMPISKGETQEEILKLNHYTNLQPLCSRKNLEKSNKVLSDITYD